MGYKNAVIWAYVIWIGEPILANGAYWAKPQLLFFLKKYVYIMWLTI